MPLEAGLARQAFALAQVFNRHLVMAQWTDYTRACRGGVRGGRGLTTLVDRRGYVHAFFAWCVQTSLAQGRLLKVNELVMGHLPGSSLPEAIAETLVELAQGADCRSIVLDLPAGTLAAASRALFVEQGFVALPQERQTLVARVPTITTACRDAS